MDSSKTEKVREFIKANKMERAMKLAGSWNWDDKDLEGQKIVRSKEILNNKRFYTELCKLKGLDLQTVYEEGVKALLNHPQFKDKVKKKKVPSKKK